MVVGDEKSIVGGLEEYKDVSKTENIRICKKFSKYLFLGTIPHEQTSKYSEALEVLIKPASNVTGVKAGGAMSCLESAGVKDVLAKSKGSSNPHNLVSL